MHWSLLGCDDRPVDYIKVDGTMFSDTIKATMFNSARLLYLLFTELSSVLFITVKQLVSLTVATDRPTLQPDHAHLIIVSITQLMWLIKRMRINHAFVTARMRW